MLGKLKRWFQDKIGIGENRDKIFYLEKRIKLNHVLLQQLLPEVLDLKPEERNLSFLSSQSLDKSVNLSIHKNDLMFLQILIAKDGNVNLALNEYYQVGFDTANLLKEIAGEKRINSFLDFGAGYGRVSRFLPSVFSKTENIFVSEIKSQAAQFNESILGLKAISHSAEVASFKPSKKFGFIFAGSVFTHLPENASAQWLHALSATLEKGGVLVFSVHNIRSFGVSDTADFAFKELSEDEFFSSTEDSIKEISTYGTSYVSNKKVADWMKAEGLNYEIKPNGFGGIQDLVIATKPS